MLCAAAGIHHEQTRRQVQHRPDMQLLQTRFDSVSTTIVCFLYVMLYVCKHSELWRDASARTSRRGRACNCGPTSAARCLSSGAPISCTKRVAEGKKTSFAKALSRAGALGPAAAAALTARSCTGSANLICAACHNVVRAAVSVM
jgi:hypothetical protein